ncbi:hypothetical protein EVAR_11174_1 [Eumeta japonica]|uniref:Uncharacterized protein n=1 Tax=Eumeta variegata TaxID=151549 RepID=A0A4C1U428_EUMVA|nr:hypothetical protein EVAR_11174_1 [Eumeta japonica]
MEPINGISVEGAQEIVFVNQAHAPEWRAPPPLAALGFGRAATTPAGSGHVDYILELVGAPVRSADTSPTASTLAFTRPFGPRPPPAPGSGVGRSVSYKDDFLTRKERVSTFDVTLPLGGVYSSMWMITFR